MQKRASHWGAARQEDAHEFFTALLHGLSDEVQQAQVGGVTTPQLAGQGTPEHVACTDAGINFLRDGGRGRTSAMIVPT